MATRKQHQLDINLTLVKDDAAREALLSIVRAVNSLSQDLQVSNSVVGREFSTHSRLGKIGRDGKLVCSGISTNETDNSEYLSFAHRTGLMSASGFLDITLQSEDLIVGATGMTSIDGEFGPSTRLMQYGSGSYNGCFFSPSSNLKNKIRVQNTDVSNANRYQVVIFFKRLERV